MKTLVVNLYGGPGTGKSTAAAWLFSQLKAAGFNAELVTEYAKAWAWQKRAIGPLDQVYLLGKQVHRESRLYGRVDVIVTDSPIALAAFYADHYGEAPLAEGIAQTVRAIRRGEHARYLDIMLTRTKDYNPAGRYETEEQARDIDRHIRIFLRAEMNLLPCEIIECGVEEWENLRAHVLREASKA